MVKEFKEFISRGNVMDLAVGVIIGGAFGAIVNSLVADVVMPLVGMLTGGIDFSNWFVVLKEGKVPGPYVSLAAAKAASAVTLNVGTFINAVVNFVIIAWAIFVMVKAINRVRGVAPAPDAAPPPPTPSEALLAEIRDLLKTQSTGR
jgi:large conductance mechanosensitive channel